MIPLYSLIIAQHPPKTRDYRLGDLGIEWIDYHDEKEILQDGQESRGKDSGEGVLERRFTRGTTLLGPGIVHLFRHSAPVKPAEEGETVAEGEDGTLVAVLAVPLCMGFHDFEAWLGAWSTRLEGFRMIRDASPNKTLVLLKFQEPTAANDFISIHTGTTFSRLPSRSETCHPIRIHHLLLQDTTLLSAPLPSLLHRVPRGSIYELPTCPVCLERMDSVVTGLITTPCTHIYNCRCLGRWTEGESRASCPVCRISRRAQGSSSPSTTSTCMRCPTITTSTNAAAAPARSNWVCMICGYLGCSRYQSGHARDHFTETGHAYSMEIETQRVWDYMEDNYVHRLIQNRSDGKLVELPSATSIVSSRLSSLSLTHGSGPTASDEKSITSLERMTHEAQRLAAQLVEEKEAYERDVERLRRELEGKVKEGEEWRGKWREEEGRRRGLEVVVEQLMGAKTNAEKKTQIATTLATTLRQDLSSEKALTTGLLAKIRTLETTLAHTAERERAAGERCKEMEETVGDLMASISMGERVKESGGAGGDLGVVQGKKKGRR